jgi:hypothetical protein
MKWKMHRVKEEEKRQGTHGNISCTSGSVSVEELAVYG